MNLKSKLFASAVAFTMVLSLVAVPVSAQTTAELTAQINSLLAMIAQLQAQIAGGSTTTTGGASMMFTTDLTVGSQGADVTALQQWLVAKGFLQMPAGVAYGYFGTLTKSALAAYQASVGITPAAGYFGPITRAKVNATAGTTTGGTTTGGTTTGGTTGITTPGVEGTLTVTTNNSGLASTVYEGDDMAAIYGFNVEAKNSDIAVQRIKVDLGSDSKVYNKGYSKLYVTEGGNVLASADLNSSTVVKESGEYYITIAGFNLIVPKNAKKQIVLKADVMSSIDEADRTTLSSVSIAIPANGVRGVDGAGLDQYGASAALTGRTTSFSADLSETATLKVSLNSASPKKQDVVAASGASENELDKLTLMSFDVKAEKDTVTIKDIRIGVVKSGNGGAVAQTVYLYDGSTELDNASITTGMASFSDVDYVVSKDSTKTLTVKVDIRSANGVVANFVGSASTTVSADLVSENSKGDSVTESGSATGYSIGVRNVGPEITLVSKSVTTSGVPQGAGSNANSTSTLAATFNVKIKAVGGDLMFGTSQATSSPLFSSTTGFSIYRNGSAVTTLSSEATSTSFTIDSVCSTASYENSCVLPEGSEITVPVTFSLAGRSNETGAFTSGLYSVGIAAINWSGNTSTFMAGETDWRTNDVSFP